MLFGLTAKTRDQVARKLAERDKLVAARGNAGALARGVTWVKVTGAISSGWYPGLVSLDIDGAFVDLADAVQVKAGDGSILTSGVRYACTRTSDHSDGRPRFEAIPPIDHGYALTFSTHTISADSTWEDTSYDLTVPGTGTYLVIGFIIARLKVSALGANQTPFIAARWNTVSGTVASKTDLTSPVCVLAPVVNVECYGHGLLISLVTVSTAATFRVQVLRGTGPTYTTSDVSDFASHPGTDGLLYLRLG